MGGGNADASGLPAISYDGRYVAFQSYSGDVAPGDDNGVSDVFLNDRQAGTTSLVSVAIGGGAGNGQSILWGGVSDDGTVVAFSSEATNLVKRKVTGLNVYVRDLKAGRTTLVAPGRARDLSADGRYVLFLSDATNLVPGDTNGLTDLFVYDRATKAILRANISGTGGQAEDGQLISAAMSADGKAVTFSSTATTLVSDDTNGREDVFVRVLGAAAASGR